MALRDAAAAPSVTGSSQAPVTGTPAAEQSQRAAEPGAVLGRIEIPRLRMTAMVAQGVDATTLGRAVGHVPWTAWPGEAGNCGLAGHRDTFLRDLRNVRVDDVIQIVTLERTTIYRVEWTKVVDPTRVDVLDSTATRSLTLVTCYPFAFVGHAPQRFIVRARQVEERDSAEFELSSTNMRDLTLPPTPPRSSTR
jgi:sortase A